MGAIYFKIHGSYFEIYGLYFSSFYIQETLQFTKLYFCYLFDVLFTTFLISSDLSFQNITTLFLR